MQIPFEQLTTELREALKGPLPGRSSQEIMAPKPVDDSRFEEDPLRPARHGGVMVLLYPGKNGIHIPLMKRPSYNGAHSGQVSLPGGKVEEQDKDIVETALRETEEEIGIRQSDIEVIGSLSEMYIIASNFKVFPTVGILNREPDFVPDPIEVAGLLTPSLNELMDTKIRKVKTMHFPQYTIHSPYFDIEGEVVWGATAMILGELVEVLKRL